MIRTDLAIEVAEKSNASEGIEITKGSIDGINFSKVILDKMGGAKIEKKAGVYITLFSHGVFEEKEESALTELLMPLIPEKGKILIVGLGNENVTPDCLGVRTVKETAATAHLKNLSDFKALSMREVYVFETGVLAQTGIESAMQLKYICDGIQPSVVIAIDSLACSETERLGKTIQITDAGIAPGSGVKNKRKEISKETLSVPVIAVGVPTVANSESVFGKENKNLKDTMVVPRDIDVVINRFARIIGRSLNRACNPTLTENEIAQLLV